jgi:GxxExxY protein
MEISDENIMKMNSLIEMFLEVASLKKGRTESVYQNALTVELQRQGIQYTEEETIPIIYKGRSVGQERIDIILQSWFPVIIELKATTGDIKPDNLWQLLNYMRYKEFSMGVVVNFSQAVTKTISYQFVLSNGLRHYTFDPKTRAFDEITDYEYVLAPDGP